MIGRRLLQPPPILEHATDERRLHNDCLLLDFDTALATSVSQLIGAARLKLATSPSRGQVS